MAIIIVFTYFFILLVLTTIRGIKTYHNETKDSNIEYKTLCLLLNLLQSSTITVLSYYISKLYIKYVQPFTHIYFIHIVMIFIIVLISIIFIIWIIINFLKTYLRETNRADKIFFILIRFNAIINILFFLFIVLQLWKSQLQDLLLP